MRFTIRDLLWLTVVVALAVAWWIERRSHRHVQAELDEHLQSHEAKVAAAMVGQAELQIQLKRAELENLRLQLERYASPTAASSEDAGNP